MATSIATGSIRRGSPQSRSGVARLPATQPRPRRHPVRCSQTNFTRAAPSDEQNSPSLSIPPCALKARCSLALSFQSKKTKFVHYGKKCSLVAVRFKKRAKHSRTFADTCARYTCRKSTRHSLKCADVSARATRASRVRFYANGDLSQGIKLAN